MGGLLLIATYALIASAGEVIAIGVGFILDQVNTTASTIVFMVNSAIVLGFAWPLALRVTKSQDE